MPVFHAGQFKKSHTPMPYLRGGDLRSRLRETLDLRSAVAMMRGRAGPLHQLSISTSSTATAR
ncbi:MAG: hypothetical protein U0794_03170 [Isosphaeraceae bacterium]